MNAPLRKGKYIQGPVVSTVAELEDAASRYYWFFVGMRVVHRSVLWNYSFSRTLNLLKSKQISIAMQDITAPIVFDFDAATETLECRWLGFRKDGLGTRPDLVTLLDAAQLALSGTEFEAHSIRIRRIEVADIAPSKEVPF